MRATVAPMILKNVVVPSLIALVLSGIRAAAQEPNLDQIISQKIQPIVPKNGEGGGVAVAVRMNGDSVLQLRDG